MRPDATRYVIIREASGVVLRADGRRISPASSLKVRNHSPDGFNFGYGGSGPAQLALALCLHFLQDKARAQRVYQDVKWKLVSQQRSACWEVSGAQLRELIEQIEAPAPSREAL